MDRFDDQLQGLVPHPQWTRRADAAKLAVTGFCWGGWAPWMYAAHNPDLKAAVAWYGSDRKPSELTPRTRSTSPPM